MKKISVDSNSINQRLDNFLLKKFKNTPKTLLYKLIRKGKFKVNKKKQSHDYKLNIGDEILITEKNLEYKEQKIEFLSKKIKCYCGLIVNKNGIKSHISTSSIHKKRMSVYNIDGSWYCSPHKPYSRIDKKIEINEGKYILDFS